MVSFLKKKLNKHHHNKIVAMYYNKNKHKFIVDGFPLLLSRLLYYIIENYKPTKFMVTGIDFYQSRQLSKFWLPGYEVKGDKQSHLIPLGKSKHNIESNKKFLIHLYNSSEWVKCSNAVLAIIMKSNHLFFDDNDITNQESPLAPQVLYHKKNTNEPKKRIRYPLKPK
jgi:hypothetical protein